MTPKEATHTPAPQPLPWRIVPQTEVSAWRIADRTGVLVADVRMHGPTTGGPLVDEATASRDYMLHAVNNYPALCAALREAEIALSSSYRLDGMDATPAHALRVVRAALALADGGK